MTKEVTTKMVEQTNIKYIANDGKVFEGSTAESDCKDYERRKNCDKCEKEFKKLNPRFVPDPALDWVAAEDELWVVPLKSEADWLVLLDYVKRGDGYMDTSYLEERKPSIFPTEIAIIIEYEYASYYGTKDELVAEMEKAIKAAKGE